MYRSGILLLPGLVLWSGCGGPPGERDFRAGVRDLEKGRYVSAKARLEKSISQRPGSEANAEAYNYLGIAAWRLDQAQAAIEAFENSRRLNPVLPEASYNLGVILSRAGDTAQALRLLEEAAQQNPEDARAYEYMGALLVEQRRWPEARRAFFSALARSPQSARVLTSLARIEYHTGDVEKSIFYLMQALEKNRDYAPALYNLGLIYEENLKDRGQASAFYRKFLDVRKNGPQVEKARRALQALAVVTAESRMDQTDLPPAPTATAQPATPAPTPAASPVEPAADKVDVLLRAAEKAYQHGEVRKALDLYREAAETARVENDVALEEKAARTAARVCFDQAEAQSEWGRFLAAQGKNEAALKAYKQALTLDGKFPPALMGLADSARRVGEYDTALVALKQAVESAPRDPEPLWTLAGFYEEQMGLSDRAAQTYRQFAVQFPGNPLVVKARERIKRLEPPPVEPTPVPAVESAPPSALPPPEPVPTPTSAGKLKFVKPIIRNSRAAVQAYNRGTFYQEKGDWDRAIYYYTRAIENDDTFDTAFYNLGTVYWSKGEFDLAKESYIFAVQIRSDQVNARYNLALIHYQLKELQPALEQLEVILKLQPNYAQAYYLAGLIRSSDPQSVEEARRLYRRFLELAPGDPSARDVRLWLERH